MYKQLLLHSFPQWEPLCGCITLAWSQATLPLHSVLNSRQSPSMVLKSHFPVSNTIEVFTAPQRWCEEWSLKQPGYQVVVPTSQFVSALTVLSKRHLLVIWNRNAFHTCLENQIKDGCTVSVSGWLGEWAVEACVTLGNTVTIGMPSVALEWQYFESSAENLRHQLDCSIYCTTTF